MPKDDASKGHPENHPENAWTHPLCDKCYDELRPGRVPVRIVDFGQQRCCSCGALTFTPQDAWSEMKPDTGLTAAEINAARESLAKSSEMLRRAGVEPEDQSLVVCDSCRHLDCLVVRSQIEVERWWNAACSVGHGRRARQAREHALNEYNYWSGWVCALRSVAFGRLEERGEKT